MQYRNIVFSGGAFKSTAFIGCIKYLEEQDLSKDIINVIGSSAGAIAGLLFTLGYSSSEMRDFAIKELTEFKNRDVDIESLFNIFYTLGIDDGEEHIKVFRRALTMKGLASNATFLDIAKHTGKNYVVCGSNLTTAKVEYFSVDTTPDMEIALAVRISTAVPFLITPVFHKGQVYVDASLFNNFPTEYFCMPMRPFTDTIALTVHESIEKTKNAESELDLLSYTRLMLMAAFVRINTKDSLIESSATNKIIDIIVDTDAFDVETFKLRADIKDIDSNIDIGYKSVLEALKQP
jgi:predicted acylesterase/phospholipase RssA